MKANASDAHTGHCCVVNVVAVETKTSGPELHAFNLRRSSAEPAIEALSSIAHADVPGTAHPRAIIRPIHHVKSEGTARQSKPDTTGLRRPGVPQICRCGTARCDVPKREGRLLAGPTERHRHVRSEGRNQISVLSRAGKEAVVAMLGPGDFFGEGALTGQSIRIGTATATMPTTVLVIEKEAMLRLLHDEPTFSARFISYMLTRNLRIEADLVDHLFNSSEKRLARTLLLLARYGDQAGAERRIPKISQETLAEMIGTTRSRVNFFMNKFRDLGFIEYNGDLKINTSLLSVVLHD